MFFICSTYFIIIIIHCFYSDLNDPIRLDSDNHNDYGGCAC